MGCIQCIVPNPLDRGLVGLVTEHTLHCLQQPGVTRNLQTRIPGLGPKRRKQLVKEFGSVARVKSASVEDIAALPGFGPKLAQLIHDALNAG